jgi:AcrR family transcriptional regulator
MSQKKPRLTKTDWLLAGFTALAEDGPDALKAEPLARRLGTTKGSFYWHFADVPAYHAAMLDLWAEQAVSHIPAAMEAEPTPTAKLRKLSQIVAAHRPESLGGLKLDAAIRAWARANALVADRLAEVDRERLRFLENLLSETGITNPEWARIIYAADIGMEDLSARDQADNASAMGSLVDLVLALR